MKFPLDYQRIQLPQYNPNVLRAMLSLKMEKVSISALKKQEVLLKIVATPINPSDIAFIQGGYNVVKSLPAVPGFEACGEVVAAGAEAQHLLGKRVSCFHQADEAGCWSEYLNVNAENCIPLRDEISWDQAATLAVNPFTAYGMFERVPRQDNVLIVLNAAGSQVAKFIRALAHDQHIQTLNIVRNSNSIPQNPHVLDQWLCSTEDDFTSKLKRAYQSAQHISVFDAVGGKETGILMQDLIPNSQVIVYGGLSNEAISNISVLPLIFNSIHLQGFNLNDYIAEKQANKQWNKIIDEVQEMVIKGIISTHIQASFPLQDTSKAIRAYIKNMSAGKVLLKP